MKVLCCMCNQQIFKFASFGIQKFICDLSYVRGIEESSMGKLSAFILFKKFFTKQLSAYCVTTCIIV